jgi:hypothetical protein
MPDQRVYPFRVDALFVVVKGVAMPSSIPALTCPDVTSGLIL